MDGAPPVDGGFPGTGRWPNAIALLMETAITSKDVLLQARVRFMFICFLYIKLSEYQ
jgi:hypothetical protein